MNEQMLIENSELLNVIRKLKTNYSVKVEEDFYKKIEKTKLLLPAILKGDNKVSILKIMDNIGNDYLPVFTDWENYELNNDDQKKSQSVVFSFTECMSIVVSDLSLHGIVINPYSDNLVLSKENLNFLEKKQVNIYNGESVSIGTPKKKPNLFIEKCKIFFEQEPSIKSAFLLQMVKNNQISLLLVIDTEYSEKIFSQVSKLSDEFLKKNEIIDMIILNTDFGRKATEGNHPFYKRK